MLNINQSNLESNTMRIARLDLFSTPCSPKVRFVNTTLDYELFHYAPTANNLTIFYNCTRPPHDRLEYLGNTYSCESSRPHTPLQPLSTQNSTLYYANESLLESLESVNFTACLHVVQVPIFKNAINVSEMNDNDHELDTGRVGRAAEAGTFDIRLWGALNRGFEVEYSIMTLRSPSCEPCERSGGRCGYENNTLKFLCFCRDRTENFACGMFLSNSSFPVEKSYFTNYVVISFIRSDFY